MRTIKIVAVAEDGEVLDSTTVPVEDGCRYIEVRDVSYSMPKYPNAEILDLGAVKGTYDETL